MRSTNTHFQESKEDRQKSRLKGDPRRVMQIFRENGPILPEDEYLWGCTTSEESVSMANVMINEGFLMVNGEPFFIHHSVIGTGVKIVLFGHHLKTLEGVSTDTEMQACYPIMTKTSCRRGVFNNTQISFIDWESSELKPISRPLSEKERISTKERLTILIDNENFYSPHNLSKITRTLWDGMR